MRWTKSMGAAALLTGLLVGVAVAQHGGHHHPAPAASDAGGKSIRITMEDLHRGGGVPPGWRFTWPDGDPRLGREVFVKLECYQCHAVKGESFPAVATDPKRTGPGLTGMGGHHPAEYFAEAIVNPNAVIVLGPGHTGDDGRSIMPDFGDSLTVTELTNLVAYIKSLTAGDGHAQHHTAHHGHAAAAPREQVAGEYRIRVDYHAAADHGPKHGGPGRAHNHLMVFVTDARNGEAVPYLPITATIHAEKSPPRAVKLAPMVGGQGFHYGADVALPATTTKVTLAIGRTTMHVMPSAAGRFARPLDVTFDWSH